MNVVYHSAVQREVTGSLGHCDRVSGELGDAFWDELMGQQGQATTFNIYGANCCPAASMALLSLQRETS